MMLLMLVFNQQVCKPTLEAETRYYFYFYTISVIPCFKRREWDSNPYRIIAYSSIKIISGSELI